MKVPYYRVYEAKDTRENGYIILARDRENAFKKLKKYAEKNNVQIDESIYPFPFGYNEGESVNLDEYLFFYDYDYKDSYTLIQ